MKFIRLFFLFLYALLFITCGKNNQNHWLNNLKEIKFITLTKLDLPFKYPMVGDKKDDNLYIYDANGKKVIIFNLSENEIIKHLTSENNFGPGSIIFLRTCEIIDDKLWVQGIYKGILFDLNGDLIREVKLSTQGQLYSQVIPIDSNLEKYIAKSGIILTSKDMNYIYRLDHEMKRIYEIKALKNPSSLHYTSLNPLTMKHDFLMKESCIRLLNGKLFINMIDRTGIEMHNLKNDKVKIITYPGSSFKFTRNKKINKIIDNYQQLRTNSGYKLNLSINDTYPINAFFAVTNKYIYLFSSKIYQSPYFYIVTVMNYNGKIITQKKLIAPDKDDYPGMLLNLYDKSFCINKGSLFFLYPNEDGLFELRKYKLLNE